MQRRVFITGLGIISPLGDEPEVFYQALVSGKSGLTACPISGRLLGRVKFDERSFFSDSELRLLDRVSQFAVKAAADAVRHAQLTLPLGDNAGIFVGTGMGGAASIEEAYKDLYNVQGAKKKMLTVPAAMTHAPAAHIGIRLGARGECSTYSTACASSGVAIAEAFRKVRGGILDLAVCGGSEALLVPGVIKNWSDMKVLCRDDPALPGSGCRPFSAERSGFALSEGAAFVVLESEQHAESRGVNLIGEVCGVGISNDAFHITQSNETGQVLAMRRALFDANLAPEQIGHVNAHGTATKIGDIVESRAINTAFGDHAKNIKISATKSAHGHLLGASGAIEFIAALKALQSGFAPPTTFLLSKDADFDLNFCPKEAQPLEGCVYAMTNSFAFGGSNASLILRAT